MAAETLNSTEVGVPITRASMYEASYSRRMAKEFTGSEVWLDAPCHKWRSALTTMERGRRATHRGIRPFQDAALRREFTLAEVSCL